MISREFNQRPNDPASLLIFSYIFLVFTRSNEKVFHQNVVSNLILPESPTFADPAFAKSDELTITGYRFGYFCCNSSAFNPAGRVLVIWPEKDANN